MISFSARRTISSRQRSGSSLIRSPARSGRGSAPTGTPLDEIIDAEIADRRANPSGDPLDILETLVADGTLDDAEIRDQVATLIGAGYDTTSASLAWMLIRATLVPGLWDRLRAEADRVLGPPATTVATPDASTLADLDLANRVIRETLRLHPAGVLSPREAAVDVTVGGCLIPKGTLILWSAHLAGRNAEAWPNPLAFDPDRFVDLDDDRRALPTWPGCRSAGARNCIGFALAQMELTLIISRLAQRLDLAPASDVVPAPVGMVVNRPTGGAPMHVGPRRGGGAAASTGSGHGTVGPRVADQLAGIYPERCVLSGVETTQRSDLPQQSGVVSAGCSAFRVSRSSPVGCRAMGTAR